MSMPTGTALPVATDSSSPPSHAGSQPLYNPITTTNATQDLLVLTLYYHPLSPFSRKVWIAAHSLSLTTQITLHKVVVAPVIKPVGFPGWSENNDLVGSSNPIAKIPTLVVKQDDDEFAVYDSKVICEYLQSLAGKVGGVRDGMYWKRQTLHRAADQMMDSEILVAYEERIRQAEGVYFERWVEGMRMKVERGFDVLQKAIVGGVLRDGKGDGDLGLEEVTVGCCLAFFDQRSVEWRQGRRELGEWFESWKKGRGEAAWESSRPDADWLGKSASG